MCLFSVNIHTCSSVVLTVKTVISNFEYVKYSSLLNSSLLKGNCFDDEQYVYRPVVRKPGLGHGLGLNNLVVFTSLSAAHCYVGLYSHSSHATYRRDAELYRL